MRWNAPGYRCRYLSPIPITITVVLRNAPIFETPDPGWVRQVQALPISHRQRRVLVAHPSGHFASTDYRKLNDVDRDTAYRELKEMVDLDLVILEGRARGARYTVRREATGAGREPLTPQRVLALRMERETSIQNADYRDAFSVDRRAARDALHDLVACGILVREGIRRGTRYRPGPRWSSWTNGGETDGG